MSVGGAKRYVRASRVSLMMRIVARKRVSLGDSGCDVVWEFDEILSEYVPLIANKK